MCWGSATGEAGDKTGARGAAGARGFGAAVPGKFGGELWKGRRGCMCAEWARCGPLRGPASRARAGEMATAAQAARAGAWEPALSDSFCLNPE